MSETANEADPQSENHHTPHHTHNGKGKGVLTGWCFEGPMQCVMAAGLTLYLIVLYALIIAFQWSLWGQQPENGKAVVFAFLFWKFYWVNQDIWYLMMVLSLGALGSIIHSGTSLAAFIGYRVAERSWFVWYVLRPLMGSLLAMSLYLILRGGLLTTVAGNADALNKYGLAGIALMSGMFTRQATNKLSEVFDTLFKVSEPQAHNTPKPPKTDRPTRPTEGQV